MIVCRPLLVLLVLASRAPAQGERLIELDAEAAAERAAAMRASWQTADDWRDRALAIRRNMLRVLDLPTLREDARNGESIDLRGPLDAIESDPRPHDGYFVQNVSLAGAGATRVTGNLYLPGIASGPAPAVLCPHGHFGRTDADPEGRFRRDMQIRCAALARMGAVVFAYDMAGWGESNVTEHHAVEALPLQTYASVRVLDYLTSRADVDPARIAITGASGGGSQSFILAALDDRIAASIPAVMVSSHFFGGCECETGLPIHTGPGLVTSNVEIAALAAPHPLLLISCGQDWTKNTPVIEFPAIREIYAMLGAPDAVENAHFAEEGHDYGPSKRAALYRFVGQRFGLDLSRVCDADGNTQESFVDVEPRDVLCVYGADRPAPPKLSAAEGIAELRAASRHR